MEYIRDLFLAPSVTQSIVLLTLVVCLGLWAGEHLRIKNFSLGITWILFVGIIFSSFGITIDPQVSHFAKNFGLILFAYSIGLQVGLWRGRTNKTQDSPMGSLLQSPCISTTYRQPSPTI